MSTPILGQEAVVPSYGLGRVVSFEEGNMGYIQVKTYIDNIARIFSPKNVRLVKIAYADKKTF